MTTHTQPRIGRPAIVAVALVLFTSAMLAQTAPPPIPGATGVAKPEKSGDGATTAIGEGARRVIDGVKSAVGKGGKRTPVETLDALKPGTKVVIRDAGAGHDTTPENAQKQTAQTKETEGTAIEIDRRTSVIVVRLADRTTERLRLVQPAREEKDRKDPSAAASGTVEVSYVGAKGDKVVQSFEPVF